MELVKKSVNCIHKKLPIYVVELKSQIIINLTHFWHISINFTKKLIEISISSTEKPYFYSSTQKIVISMLISRKNGVDSGVESGVSRVDFLRLTRSESSRKVPTHFEH